ncbi:hypothetical protein ACGF3G_21115 [Streptomyces sp. NPDC048179]|uniref:hypothetical protein n=1 Tax=Streptomyces sp. NPDC048179 TaxID=3365506 RepID=UPI0037223EB0
MIESQVPDLGAVPLRDLLDSNDSALRHGVLWVGAQADRAPAAAVAGDGAPGGGAAERVD